MNGTLAAGACRSRVSYRDTRNQISIKKQRPSIPQDTQKQVKTMATELCELVALHGDLDTISSEEAAQTMLNRLQLVLPQLACELASGSLSARSAEDCMGMIQRIKVIAHHLTCAEQDIDDIQTLAELDATRLLSESNEVPFTVNFNTSAGNDQSDGCHNAVTIGDDDDSLAPYRLYFLKHLCWPYPTSSQRAQLLLAVPSHGRAQLSNWFVNSRRRSGWSVLARMYGEGTKEGMQALLDRVETGTSTEEEERQLKKVRQHFEDDGSSSIRPELQGWVDKIESDMRRQSSSGKQKRKMFEDESSCEALCRRKRAICESSTSPSPASSSEESQSSLPSSPTLRSYPTLDSFGDLQIEFSRPQPLPRGLQDHESCVDSPAASFEYPKAGVPASRRCVSDSRSHISPKRSTPPYRSVSSSFALGMESMLAGSLTMPIEPNFLATCPTAGSAWNGGESAKTSDYRFASTSPSTLGADHSDATSLNTTTMSNTWYETLQGDRWTDLYPWLGRGGSDSLSGVDIFGQDEEVNWLMGTELVGLC